jgi:RHS repeat-associated protein
VAESSARSAAQFLKQYVWGIRYIDSPLCRFRDGDPGSPPDGTADETLYYANDGNFNVTALVNTDGTVAERIIYSPYGQPTFLKADWTPSNGPDGQNGTADDGTASDFHNAILYCGYRFDSETGLYHVRHRYLHPTLGRWITQDPAGYVDGLSLYEYCRSGPMTHLDPSGLVARAKGVKLAIDGEDPDIHDKPLNSARLNVIEKANDVAAAARKARVTKREIESWKEEKKENEEATGQANEEISRLEEDLKKQEDKLETKKEEHAEAQRQLK